jgi:hypothetical protein
MTTQAGLTTRQLAALVVADDEETGDELRAIGLLDDFGRLTIAGRACLPALLPYGVLRLRSARELICEIEAEDRQA